LLTLKLIFGLVMVGLLVSALAVSLFFGSPGRSYPASNNSPEGSWLIHATITSDRPPFKFQALMTYENGGGLVVTDQTDFNLRGLTSPGHGALILTHILHMDFVKWLIKPSRMVGCITTSPISFRSTSEPKKMWVRIRHGAWVSTGEGHFATTWLAFFFDAKGNPAGMVKVREVDTLSADGNSFSGSATFTAFNANGKPVLSGTTIEDGKRIIVEGV
jgi:hypothetical protein